MKKKNYRLNLKDLPLSSINHGTGQKRVFIVNNDTTSKLTQFALSKFEAGEVCEEHSHLTMDEYYFILKGIYEIGIESLELNSGDFIRIPAGTPHKLRVDNKHEQLELLYFGVAIN